MKKFITLTLLCLFMSKVFGASDPMHVVNVTTSYSLFFNIKANTINNCYPELIEHNLTGTSGYCELPAEQSIDFQDFQDFANYYPNLIIKIKTNFGNSYEETSIVAADALMNSINMNWSSIIYKASSSTNVEGVPIGFSDFYDCHGLEDAWGIYNSTETYSFTTFTIGEDRYFIVGEY